MNIFELGIMSKIYLPIKKYNLSPYIGAGLSRRYTESVTPGYTTAGYPDVKVDETYQWQTMLLLGASWYVGPGSWDFGLQIGKDFNVTLGYTFLF
jgi:hypothetical protein